MKIAIVNDVAMAIEAVRQVVLSTGEHEIVWTATNGREAVEQCCRNKPDLVLMDLIMPRAAGVEATRRIMARCPCAILVVTANVTNNCSKVFEAMGAGALDAVNTPALEWPNPCNGARELLAKIETIRKLIGAENQGRGLPRRPHAAHKPEAPDGRLIVIGASAGGPAALARILPYLPSHFRSPIVLVQHVDAQFAPALASWLDDQTPLQVRVAQEGDSPSPGTILLAGRDRHLVFTGHQRLTYTDRPTDCSYRPSVDVFLNSIQHHWRGGVVGVLLTGMGRDGAEGMRNLRQNGHHTIAQDQASCAVYGMPKAAVELCAATEVLSLEQIGVRLRAFGTQGVRIHA
jgi:chemotaxis response regulator CheB